MINQMLASLVQKRSVAILPTQWETSIVLMAFAPLGAILVAALCLYGEYLLVGWPCSSLQRIWRRDPSATVDLFHAFLYASNLKSIFGVLFSLGLGHLFYFWVLDNFSLFLLRDQNFFLSSAILWFVNSFLFYWVHRTMHSPLFWHVHKVHHSATEMNLITNFRNHPLNNMVEMTFYALSAAVLGASVGVTIFYLVLNGIYQIFAHSNFTWKLRGGRWAWIQDWVLLAPEEHRLHHSREAQHFDKNFGLTPLWDRVFGTWLVSDSLTTPLHFGIDQVPDQKLLASVKGIFVVAWDFFDTLFQMIFGSFSGALKRPRV